ncbi:MAG TPA: hypothetical protein VJZ00_05150, partial [Thermoanaerobaculia bacterium]|nr:hypothetical protein [Thermoanaerobaculia bacterium]
MIRSLRWRLVLAMALILSAVIAGVGVFSSVTVKREFDRYLVAQRRDEALAAEKIVRDAPTLTEGLRSVHERFGLRSLAFDARQRVIGVYPQAMRAYRVTLRPHGGIELRNGFEVILLKGAAREIDGKGTVYFLPPVGPKPGARDAFRVSVDRGLLAGLAAA